MVTPPNLSEKNSMSDSSGGLDGLNVAISSASAIRSFRCSPRSLRAIKSLSEHLEFEHRCFMNARTCCGSGGEVGTGDWAAITLGASGNIFAIQTDIKFQIAAI